MKPVCKKCYEKFPLELKKRLKKLSEAVARKWACGRTAEPRERSHCSGPGSWGADNVLFVHHHAISTLRFKLTVSKLGDIEEGKHPVIFHEHLYLLWCLLAWVLQYIQYNIHTLALCHNVSKQLCPIMINQSSRKFWHLKMMKYISFSVVITHHLNPFRCVF